ncbi:hypothetical protein ACTNA4_05455 [Bariatricus sp. HCP28S3_A7]|uniref:hypothetical protein n=1 Tax=Bariatricus sp. HCP28S3_A7 TaxID=3438894 RepID=UPI003F893DA7
MSELLVLRERIQKIYAGYSIYVDKAVQFILGLVSFYLINQNIGMMKSLTTPVVMIALAVICTFLPPVTVALVSAALILAHLFKLSMGVMAVSAMIFVMMFIFYCRFTPKRALVLLVTPIAFMLHVPYVVPVVCGLAMTPVTVVPIAFGTMIYYMILCVKNSAAAISATEGITGQISFFVRTVFQNKELWITVIAFTICIFTVYVVRRLSIDHAWKVAVAAGAVANILVIVIGDIVFDIHTSYGILIGGNVLAIAIGLVLEFFLFSVDYSRTEHIQYEDDEYYYYVKAVPKMSVAAPEKTVKRINERRDPDERESEEIRRRPSKRTDERKNVKKRQADKETKKNSGTPGNTRVPANTDELLLAKSLQDELDIQDIVKRELEDR